MPRFFFNIVSESGLVKDLEGTELDDLEHARREAIKDARLLMSQSILIGDDVSSRSIYIVDEGGTVLLALPFTEAFKTLK